VPVLVPSAQLSAGAARRGHADITFGAMFTFLVLCQLWVFIKRTLQLVPRAPGLRAARAVPPHNPAR
jgi:hypothetical protein